MKAILCSRFGGPDDLEYADIPDPVPSAGEVVVAVKSAADPRAFGSSKVATTPLNGIPGVTGSTRACTDVSPASTT